MDLSKDSDNKSRQVSVIRHLCSFLWLIPYPLMAKTAHAVAGIPIPDYYNNWMSTVMIVGFLGFIVTIGLIFSKDRSLGWLAAKIAGYIVLCLFCYVVLS